ncbi:MULTISPECIES: ABC transporter ATP-binding protein [Hydrogenibacillus]|uniref:Branched-chain amino acid transport ATP-binding protein LivG n=2 Tax=Hydrogenibacillus schlegelii TaxID=1484 RepID=A0A2T5GBT1_HYDSH|nr:MULTISPECIES: ABC transporter ATP-binding protein [Hydrogenibacillus]PTQ53653.1 MAG: Branched-chain amino acid transport ATP-binding protein LivG [Hydrogenibacillus schlegelii]QZA32401.1 ABC transporter ATP-binding protein [Hydrogenibacillus sp. N12]
MALLEVKNVSKRFGGVVAVDDVSFSVEEGEILALIGPNGSGKTTLFNLITGVFRPTAGEIVFQGARIDGLPTDTIIRRGIGRTFQIVRPLRRMTVLENVMVGAFLHTRRREVAERRALEVLALTGLYERRHEEARTLPIAGRKRLEVARALATEPKLLLLDEVAAGLNPKEVEAVMALIRTLKESGVTILMVEHIMKVVLGVATRALALNFGRTIAAGTPEEVTRHPDVVRAYLGERRHA